MDVVEIGLWLAYLLLGFGLAFAILMPFVQALIQDPKSLVKTAIGLVAILVVYGLGYALAGDEVTPKYAEFGVDSGLSNSVGGLLITMYILMFTALIGIIITEVSGLVK